MLTRSNRSSASTLLDAEALNNTDDKRDAIIFVETGRSPIHISRPDFLEEVGRQADGLKSSGIEPGDLVVIAHTQNLESIFSFWGAMSIGAIPSMFPTLTEKLDPEIYMGSMAELVRLSGVRAILTTDEFSKEMASQVECTVLGSTELRRRADRTEPDSLPTYSPDPEEIAFLQHSSGTTGLQKGVALSHSAVLNQLASYGEAIALNPDDVVVSWLPLYHDMGLIAGFLMPLFQGIPLVIMSPFDWVQHPALLLRAINDHRGTLCWLPNFAYNHSARRIRQRDLEGLSLSSMRLFINCSEPVHHASHELFLERFADLGLRKEMLAVSYAMAENTFAVTQTAPGKAPHLDFVVEGSIAQKGRALKAVDGSEDFEIRVSCGRPIAGTEVKVVDDHGQTLPDRLIGEFAIRSNCMLSGYYRRPDLSPFQDGWYLTGDRGYIAGGEIFVIGRSKDLIINAGKNIYPQDIEAVVNRVPGVHPGRAVAFGVEDDREGTELIAVVAEVNPENREERKRIASEIRRRVTAECMVTVSYVHLVSSRWLIKTSSGKIIRQANREKWMAETGNTVAAGEIGI